MAPIVDIDIDVGVGIGIGIDIGVDVGIDIGIGIDIDVDVGIGVEIDIDIDIDIDAVVSMMVWGICDDIEIVIIEYSIEHDGRRLGLPNAPLHMEYGSNRMNRRKPV